MTLTGYNSKQYSSGDKEPPKLPQGNARIYSMRFCPFCEKTLIYAAKHGIDAEIININLNAKPEWYFKKNTKGSVPTFEQDGKIVIESNQIALFLDDLHPSTAILPKDPFERAHHRILADQLSSINKAYSGVISLMKKDQPTKEEVEETVAVIEDALDDAERFLPAGKTYFGGDSASYPDCMVYPFVERIWVSLLVIIPELIEKKGITTTVLRAFPKSKDEPFPGTIRTQLTKWFGIMRESEEVRAVSQSFETLASFTARHVASKVDGDFGL